MTNLSREDELITLPLEQWGAFIKLHGLFAKSDSGNASQLPAGAIEHTDSSGRVISDDEVLSHYRDYADQLRCIYHRDSIDKPSTAKSNQKPQHALFQRAPGPLPKAGKRWIAKRKIPSAPRWQPEWSVSADGKKRILTVREVKPMSARQLSRLSKIVGFRPQNQLAPTLSLDEFGDDFLNHCSGRWKPATESSYRSIFKNHISPTLGHLQMGEIERRHTDNWFVGPAGRRHDLLTLLKQILDHAELLELRPAGSNPCAGLRRKKTGFVGSYPTPDEYRKLGIALDELQITKPTIAATIRFLAVTGSRCSEALGMEWSHVNAGRAVLPDSKTGPKTIWLPNEAMQILEQQRAESPSRHVFGIHGKPVSRSTLSLSWRHLRRRAGLGCLRLHDLRHGFASTAVNSGVELKTLSELLGHSDLDITLGYAHLASETVHVAAQRTSSAIASASGLTKHPYLARFGKGVPR